MCIGVLGINFKTAPLAIREQLAKASHYAFSPNSIARKLDDIVLLSTCNRTEIYFGGEDLAEKHIKILALLREFVSFPFEQKLYSLFGSDCFLHLATVASGLDSAILAETEIQQQVRLAYEAAHKVHHLSNSLHFFFQKSLKISKSVRTRFPLPRGLASLESVLLELALNSGMKKVLLIGNSQINRQIIKVFQKGEDLSLTLCTRIFEKGEELTLYPSHQKEKNEEKKITLTGWSALKNWQKWDMVICATQHGGYLLKESKKGKEKPQLLIDLSVPRLIDPSLSFYPYIRLLNIEEMAKIVDHRRRHLLEKVEDSQAFLQRAVHLCMEAHQKRLLRKYACVNF